MNRLIVMVSLLTLSLGAYAGDAFSDLDVGASWTKVQDRDVTQWSVMVPDTTLKTRIDFLSYVEHKKRISFYVVRQLCDSGKISVVVVRPGAEAGLAGNCEGNVTVLHTKGFFDKVDPLPPEARTLL